MTEKAIANVFSRHGLNEKQKAFVLALLEGCPAAVASERAGFAGNSWPYLMRMPAVTAALHEGVQQSLMADAPVNFRVLREIRDDKDAPKGVRADVAMKLARLAGHIEPTTRDKEPDKQLSEMSGAELRAYIERNQADIDRLEGELAARAIEVSAPASAPTDAPSGPNALDYLG